MALEPVGGTGPVARGRPGARKILIAEDEANIVISLEFLLKDAGYEVAVARDGSAALSLAGSWRPDLIVLDVMLPAVNGFEVCKRIRDSHEMRAVKILMLTARGRESEMEKGLAAGADAYMTKPFATKELVARIAQLLASG
jgi:DNA-binding response OmpR family regulator